MQAAFYETTGTAREVLQLGPLEMPQPGPGEVRVRIVCSGVNPSDVKSRAGLRNKTLPFPRIVPHSDGAGVIDAVGEGVTRGRPGDRVWVWNAAWKRAWGTAAEYVVLPAQQVVSLPESTPFDAGACLGIPALTAYHAAAVDGGVAGKTVLVAGGAGAVGHYAVQMARLLGARQVFATVSSPAKAELALQAGADLAIDYRTDDVAARVRAATDGLGVDRIIEVDIAANAALDLQLLKQGGDLVVYGSGAGEFRAVLLPADHAAREIALLHRVRTRSGRSRPSRRTSGCHAATGLAAAQRGRAFPAVAHCRGARTRGIGSGHGQRGGRLRGCLRHFTIRRGTSPARARVFPFK